MLSNSELESFVKADLETYDLKELNLDLEIAEEAIERDLLEGLEDLNSEDTIRARLDHFSIEGSLESDYLERLYKVDKDNKFLYGIRHLGGNPNLPFIQLQTNFGIECKMKALELYNKIEKEFSKFSPLYLSFQSKIPIDADFIGSIFMVAPTCNIDSRIPWDSEDRIQFEDAESDQYYPWYEAGYSAFHEDSPELKEKVTLNAKDVMDNSLEQGLLKYILIDGERVGLIAGENSQLLGHSGTYFNEIFLQKKWKGQGLAKAIQRKFISEFAKGSQLIWGTIDSNNLPSYKTAYSNGRRPIRYENFINLK